MRAWAAALALVGGLMACADAPPPPPPPPSPAKAAAPAVQSKVGDVAGIGLQQELEDVTFRQARGTTTQWELHADKVVQRGEGLAKLSGVTLRYYGEDEGGEPVIITADEADYHVELQDATLRGHVHVETARGDTLDTDLLEWSSSQEMVRTDAEVTLRRGNSYITGQGLQATKGMQDVELREVHGVIQNAQLAG